MSKKPKREVQEDTRDIFDKALDYAPAAGGVLGAAIGVRGAMKPGNKWGGAAPLLGTAAGVAAGDTLAKSYRAKSPVGKNAMKKRRK